MAWMPLMLSIAACESDDKKLERLQADQLTECLLAQRESTIVATQSATLKRPGDFEARDYAKRDGDTALVRKLDADHSARWKAAGIDTLTDKWLAQRRACDLATRELNRFMR